MRAVFIVAALALTMANARAQDLGTPPGDMLLPVDPDAPTVGASVDRTEAFIGDHVTLTISATMKDGFAVTLPPKIELDKFEILERSENDKAGTEVGNGRHVRRFLLTIASYEVGTHAIPEIQLTYINPRGEVRFVETEPLLVTVKGLIAEENKPEMQPLRPTRSTMVEDKRLVAAALYGGIGTLTLMVFLGVFFGVRRWLRWRQKAQDEAAIPARPADEVAMEKLQALHARGQFDVDGYRPFYFELAEILRAFLGARFDFDSLELTTSELLTALHAHAPELATQAGEVAQFLNESDLVKFAKAGSTNVAAVAAFDFVKRTVLAYAKRLEDPVAAGVAAAASATPADITTSGESK